MKLLFTAILALSYSVLFGQTIDHLYRQIELKLIEDRNYLDIYSIQFLPSQQEAADLGSFPLADGKGNFSFRSSENISYDIVFLKDNYEFDSLVVLFIRQVSQGGDDGPVLFQEAGASGIDSTIAVRFKDIQELYFHNREAYQKLYLIVERVLRDSEPFSLVKLITDEDVQSEIGVSSPGNTDFINFNYVNNIHTYPKFTASTTPTTSSRRRGGTAQTTAMTDFKIDFSFSHLTFFHNMFDYDFGTISAEFNTNTPMLNILPWQASTFSGGIRALVNIDGLSDLSDAFLIDAKILGRFRIDMTSFNDKLPFIFGKKSLINVGNGFVFDLKTTGIYDIPFFELYFATGSEDLENPYYINNNIAYFSFTQWQALMSFYWNSSEKRTVRFKLSLGIGGHDIVEGDYSGAVIGRRHMKDVVQPVLEMSMNIVPNNVEFLGINGKFFDSHLTAFFWIKLLEFSNDHSFRVEMQYISSTFFREPELWEQPNGQSLVQLRYRYGF